MFSCSVVLYVWTLSSFIASAIKIHSREYSEKSKLVLFQGTKRFVLDGKDCPVGITFSKPERFSCACVTGVWAFYDEWCAPPVKVVGGVDHCFLMPPLWQVMSWSNPLRVLDKTLTAFDGDEAYVKVKVYRNTHMDLANTSSFVTNNSSWTLLGPDGQKLCLNARPENKIFAHSLSHSESLRASLFCHFSQVDQHIPEVKTFKPGCKGKFREVKPYRCDNFEDPIGEFICTQPQVVTDFDRFSMASIVVPEFRTRAKPIASDPDREREKYPADTFSMVEPMLTEKIDNLESRSKQNWDYPGQEWKRDKKSSETVTVLETEQPEIMNPVKSSEKNVANERFVLDMERVAEAEVQPDQIFVDFPPENSEPEIQPDNAEDGVSYTIPLLQPIDSYAADVNTDTTLRRKNPEEESVDDGNHGTDLTEENFLDFNPQSSESSSVVLTQLLAYHEEKILTILNLNRQDDLDPVPPTQIFQLLNISTQIMQRTCSIVPPEFVNMSLQIFLNVQHKHINWNPPFINNFQFQRIRHSLLKCLRRAQPFSFEQGSSNCKIQQHPTTVFLDEVELGLTLDPVFNSDGFEPIIESVWKTVVNAHSYCYADFSHFYNDHHQYTVFLAAIFTNKIYQLWFRNLTLRTEYNGIAGNVRDLLERMERCIAVSRLVSAYPWSLSRPSLHQSFQKQSNTFSTDRRKRRDLRSKKIRVQLPANLEPPKHKSKAESSDKIQLHKTSSADDTAATSTIAHERTKNFEWETSRRTFNGLGVCLKKFDEPKVKLGQMCE